MQSQIEVDKEDLYKKINCKGKKMVGKANNWINGEKIIVGLNNSKLKLKKVKKKEKKANSTDLQKPNTEAEVYNNTKKCDWIYKYTYTPYTKLKQSNKYKVQ